MKESKMICQIQTRLNIFKLKGTFIRVGTKYMKFSDQAPNWAKVVPWYGV